MQQQSSNVKAQKETQKNILREILQDERGVRGRVTEMKFIQHPGMATTKFRQGATTATQVHHPNQQDAIRIEPLDSHNKCQLPVQQYSQTTKNGNKHVRVPSDAGFTQTAANYSHAVDSCRTRASKPSTTSIDLNSIYPQNSSKIVYLESGRTGGARRGTTDAASTQKGTTSKTQIVESSQHQRSNKVIDYDESFQSNIGSQKATSRTNFPQNTDPKTIQSATKAAGRKQSAFEENGPNVIDSARRHNQYFLDQVIAPIQAVSKRTSTQSISGGGGHCDLDERHSTESVGLAKLPSMTSDAMSNRASHTRQRTGEQASKGSEPISPVIVVEDQGRVNTPSTPKQKVNRSSQEQLDQTGEKDKDKDKEPSLKQIGEYRMIKDLGEGTFGKVKLGQHMRTKKKVAIKILEMRKIAMMSDRGRVAREIKILKEVRHVNIIQLFEIIETSYAIFMIMEYAEGGELFDYIVKKGRLDEKEAAFFYNQLLEGVQFLHGRKIAHRDLKPENLLLDKDCKTIKIVDFGLSNIYMDAQGNEILLATACGSPCYAAPEMVEGSKYIGYTVDVWSSGITLYAMICGYLPFEESETALLYQKILKGYYEIPSFLSIDAVRIIKGLLTVNPKERLTFEQIDAEPWLQQGKPVLIAPPQKKHVKNMTYDGAVEKSRRSRQNSLTLEPIIKPNDTDQKQEIEVIRKSKVTHQQSATKRSTQVFSQLSAIPKRQKVHFDVNQNKTTLPPPTKPIVPHLDSTQNSQRATSNNSCTGGSSDAKNGKVSSNATMLSTHIQKVGGGVMNNATTKNTSTYSTGQRLLNLDTSNSAYKKNQTVGSQNVGKTHYQAFSPVSNSSRVSKRIQLAADVIRGFAATPQGGSQTSKFGTPGLSNDLYAKVFDASATQTMMPSSSTQGAKKKSSILIQQGAISCQPKKVPGGARNTTNLRMSPINKYMKDSIPQSKLPCKRHSAKKYQQKTTLNQSRGDSMAAGEYISRAKAKTSLSPEPYLQAVVTRPRKIKMPASFNPECLFTAKSSKTILQRIKVNLAKLCDISNSNNNLQLLKWTSKYSAEIMDLCRVELLQIEGISIADPSSPSSIYENQHHRTESAAGAASEQSSKLNLYLVQFSRPEGGQKRRPETMELFSNIQETTLEGLPQTYAF